MAPPLELSAVRSPVDRSCLGNTIKPTLTVTENIERSSSLELRSVCSGPWSVTLRSVCSKVRTARSPVRSWHSKGPQNHEKQRFSHTKTMFFVARGNLVFDGLWDPLVVTSSRWHERKLQNHPFVASDVRLVASDETYEYVTLDPSKKNSLRKMERPCSPLDSGTECMSKTIFCFMMQKTFFCGSCLAL